MEEMPQRKALRAVFHDYSGGAYFITICTKDMKHYFGKIYDGAMHLNLLGEFCRQQLENIPIHYTYAQVPVYTIMPNHIHAIILISGADVTNRFRSALSVVVGGVKSAVKRYANSSNTEFHWQSRYNDHIIRNMNEAHNIAEYISTNVARWGMDHCDTH